MIYTRFDGQLSLAFPRRHTFKPWSFPWFTDTHVQRPMTWNPGEPEALFSHVDAMGYPFLIDTGDCADTCQVEQYEQYLAMVNALQTPYYCLPGNHDQVQGDASGQYPNVTDWTNYDQYLGQHHWSFEHRGLAFVGFTSIMTFVPDPNAGFGAVEDSELDYLESALIAAGDKIKVICTHFPILSNFGGQIKKPIRPEDVRHEIAGNAQRLMSLIEQYDVRLALTGHRHLACLHASNGRFHEVNGGTSSYIVDQQGQGGYQIVDVWPSKIVVRFFNSRAPFNEYGPGKPGVPFAGIEIKL